MSALLQVCAYKMPPVELEGLRQTFEAIDKDHSGSISLEELTNHLQVSVWTHTRFYQSVASACFWVSC